MQINIEQCDSTLIVTPSIRRLDASVCMEFRTKVQDEIDSSISSVLIDLSNVDFIDSSALGVIVSLLKGLNGRGEVALCSLNNNIRNLFTLTRMDRVFVLYASREEAIHKIMN